MSQLNMENPFRRQETARKSRETIAVVVLGDLDRSPRMVNHALEASEYFEAVDLIGIQGSSLQQSVTDRTNIRVTYISVWLVDLFRKLPRALYVLYAIARLIIQTYQLIWHLLIRRITRPYDYLVI